MVHMSGRRDTSKDRDNNAETETERQGDGRQETEGPKLEIRDPGPDARKIGQDVWGTETRRERHWGRGTTHETMSDRLTGWQARKLDFRRSGMAKGSLTAKKGIASHRDPHGVAQQQLPRQWPSKDRTNERQLCGRDVFFYSYRPT